MLPLTPDQTKRVETTMRLDDYELLERVAKNRKTSIAAILRNLLYEHIQPLKMAQQEREAISLQRAREEKAWAEWSWEDRQKDQDGLNQVVDEDRYHRS